MPLQETSGNATADAYGGGAAAKANYIEDVFSTWLYSGTGAGSSNLPQTISNGIDLSTKGGLVWIKARNTAGDSNYLFDTSRTAGYRIESNLTDAQAYNSDTLTSFNTNGFTLGTDGTIGGVNYSSSRNYASWTFRKQPKFFDVVTYTGDGSSTQVINHSLGARPGAIFFKKVSSTSNWVTYNRVNDTTTFAMFLNKTDAALGISNSWMTSTNFTAYQLGADTGFAADNMNDSGATYVAYLFAHNAGGFGLTGTDNVISCGSFTTDSTSRATVNLGYEPQWLLFKATGTAQSWFLVDTMRGWVNGTADNTADDKPLYPNLSNAEGTDYDGYPTATGFQMYTGNPSATYIYIAIRRGPMKTPTSGTSVFVPVAQTGDSNISVGFPTDFGLRYNRAGGATIAVDRLRGARGLYTPLTDAESAASTVLFDQQNLMTYGLGAGASVATYQWRRAPGFFDEVCYTGTNSGTLTNTHNLGVTPELMIGKNRGAMTNNTNWYVYHKDIANSGYLNLTNAFTDSWRIGNPTATTFDVRGINDTSSSLNYSTTYVAYLFASCPGVSKVGSYTGNGTTQTINCGFTGGARFVLIKRTDSTGDWYVYDTARGMTTLTDPYLLLNSTAAESATLGSVTSVTGGFALNASILAAINTSGGSYIFLAIS